MLNSTEDFYSYDGLKLNGTYSRPIDEPRAAVLLIHGITSERDEEGYYSRMAETFAQSGIASFRFEYRSHGPNSLPSVDMTLSGIVSDIHSAYELLKKNKALSCPLFAVGTSFGGGLTAFWASKNNDELRGLFLCAPVIDYEDDIERYTEDWRNFLNSNRPVLYADTMEFGRGLLNELPFINGIEALSKPTAPVHIYHGEEDSDVPIKSSMIYADKSDLVQLHRIPEVGHGFGAPGDEDFDSPETLAIHDSIYSSMIEVITELLE